MQQKYKQTTKQTDCHEAYISIYNTNLRLYDLFYEKFLGVAYYSSFRKKSWTKNETQTQNNLWIFNWCGWDKKFMLLDLSFVLRWSASQLSFVATRQSGTVAAFIWGTCYQQITVTGRLWVICSSASRMSRLSLKCASSYVHIYNHITKNKSSRIELPCCLCVCITDYCCGSFCNFVICNV